MNIQLIEALGLTFNECFQWRTTCPLKHNYWIPINELPSLKLTKSHLTNGGWEAILSFWVSAYFQVLYLCFREGTLKQLKDQSNSVLWTKNPPDFAQKSPMTYFHTLQNSISFENMWKILHILPRSWKTAGPWRMMLGRWIAFWVSAYFQGRKC